MAATDRLPRFFIVYLSHFSSESLAIPSFFNELLPRRLPKTATLQGAGGCFWKVAFMAKRDGGICFGQGWSKFVEDNLLKSGDLLTFVYDGKRVFEVSIFGAGGTKEKRAIAEVVDIEDDSVYSLSSNDTDTSSEPEIPNTIARTRNSGKSRVEAVDDDSDEEDSDSDNSNSDDSSYSPDIEENMTTLTIPNATTSRKRGTSKSVRNVEASSSTLETSNRKYEPKIKNPEAYLLDPANIHFETSVKKRIYELLIRSQIVKDYNLKFEEYVEFIDKHGKLKAKAMTWSDHRVCIKQWIKIIKRNNLKKGDGVLVELLRNQNVVYAIHIHVVREKDL
ncbi:hypothetical protein AALP_AA7G214300 [Arabis alpina]|uniref:TF-B3 domain-containing protein n=1 Tax=Arabis alpina TaxID=50452 RepID=A0A087GJN1_ARAAL|nr:hypothetical protein AALP_AA7G214300 [Arabis alpina]